MPYGIRKSGDKYKVVNKESGRVFGTHESEAKAKKQLAALYANANPKNESKMLDVRMVLEGSYVEASVQVIEEAVKKEILLKAATRLDIDPASLMQFIKDVDTEESLPHGNWICMVAAKGMPLDEKTKGQLKMMLAFFVRFKTQVIRAGKSGNIFDYETYAAFKEMIFSFAKNAYDYDPTQLPGVTKVVETGPYAMYKVSAKDLDPQGAQAVVESIAKMGNGTKWCTRSEYNPSLGNAKYYLLQASTDKTMFVVTKFNAPYAQLQSNLESVMDTQDRDVLRADSSLHGTFELSELFAKAAKELDLSRQSAKNKFLSLVGIRTKKSIEHFRSQGFDEATILMNISKPLVSMGYTEEEANQFFVDFINKFEADEIYQFAGHLLKLAEPLFKALLLMPLTTKSLQFGGLLLLKFLSSENNAKSIPSDTVRELMKQYIDKLSQDHNIPGVPSYIYAYCVLVQKAKWPEKEHFLKGIFESEPNLEKIYNNLESVEADDPEAERDADIKSLLALLERFIKGARANTHYRYNMVEALRDTIVLYGEIPEVEKLCEQYISSMQERKDVKDSAVSVLQNYRSLLNELGSDIEEIQDIEE